MSRLTREYYSRAAALVARDLLGTVFVRETPDGLLRGRLVETEAYAGRDDPGSHAFRGSTPRTQVMFGPAGYLYVYISYGMHVCMNVVTGQPGIAEAVLVRAVEPLEGIEIMERNRGRRHLVDLCNGPGKLCQAFGITREHNGADLLGQEMWIEDGDSRPQNIVTSTRVGLSAGRDLPLRYFLPNNQFVSRGKPSVL